MRAYLNNQKHNLKVEMKVMAVNNHKRKQKAFHIEKPKLFGKIFKNYHHTIIKRKKIIQLDLKLIIKFVTLDQLTLIRKQN